jgi:hypothetical protein
MIGWIVWLAAALTVSQQEEINEIDAQIKTSMQEKKRHEALASKYGDTAFRMQTNQKGIDARRFYQMQEQEQEVAQYLQKEIDALEKRKAEILNGQ